MEKRLGRKWWGEAGEVVSSEAEAEILAFWCFGSMDRSDRVALPSPFTSTLFCILDSKSKVDLLFF